MLPFQGVSSDPLIGPSRSIPDLTASIAQIASVRWTTIPSEIGAVIMLETDKSTFFCGKRDTVTMVRVIWAVDIITNKRKPIQYA